MMNSFFGGLGALPLSKHMKSRAINAENPTGEKGKGGRAASPLGPSRKGSPCLKDIPSGATVTLADIDGPGVIRHIDTVDNKTSDADCFVLREIWCFGCTGTGKEEPSVETPLGDFFCCGFGRGCTCQFPSCGRSSQPGIQLLFSNAFQKESKNHTGKSACQRHSCFFLSD